MLFKTIFRRIVDNRNPDSVAGNLRRKRHAVFMSLIGSLPRPLTILDVGGTESYWQTIGVPVDPSIHITLLNLSAAIVSRQNFRSMVGDARFLSEFRDAQFDIVFSNSMIEHLGRFSDQVLAAGEMMRVGKRVFLQTPNRFFPIEPHFLIPFFQFLPFRLRTFLLRKCSLGWAPITRDKKEAEQIVSSIRLLTEKELKELFPGGVVQKESLFGLTKSFIVVKDTLIE